MPLFSPKWGRSNKDKVSTKKGAQNEQNGGIPSDPFFEEIDSQPRTVLPNSVSLSDLEKTPFSDAQTLQSDCVVRTYSRLTKTLYEILHDKDALPYFIQYMDSRKVGHLIRFWLDAESFKVSALTRVRSRSFNQDTKPAKLETMTHSAEASGTSSISPKSQQPTIPSSTGGLSTDALNTAASSSSVVNTNNSGSGKRRGVVVQTSSACTDLSGQGQRSISGDPVQGHRSVAGDVEPPIIIQENIQNTLCDNNPQCKDVPLPSNGVHSNRTTVLHHQHQYGCDGNLSNPVELLSVLSPVVAGDDHLHAASSPSLLSNDTKGLSSTTNSITPTEDSSPTIAHYSNNNSAHGGSTNMLPSPERGNYTSSSSPCDAANANIRNQCNKGSGSNSSSGASKGRTENQNGGQDTVADGLLQQGLGHSVPCAMPSRGTEGTTGCLHPGTTGNTDTGAGDGNKEVMEDEGGKPAVEERKISIQEKLLQSIAQDAVRMFSKYIALEATHPIGASEEMRAETIRQICSEDGQVDPNSFVQCQDFVVSKMDTLYHGDFLLSCFHCKHQFDILSSSDVYLADFLYNDTAFSYLTEYTEQEGVTSLLQCWLDLDSFQQLLVSRHGQYDGLEAQNDAMVIYDKYFSLQATQPLGFSDSIRLEVEGNICREQGPLPDCFCKAKMLVLRALEKHYFPGFVQSEVYFKYMADLMNTVQAADIPTATRKRKESDAISTTSEHSTGSQSVQSEGATKNTLLAAGKSYGIRKALHKMEDNMQIDGALFNPESLWKRPQSGKMSLGKVDELGRFVSELELEPDKPKLGFLKKKKEKDQTQEEMAAQIAMKIVAGITANSQVAGEATFPGSDFPL